VASSYQQIWDGKWEPLDKDQYIACCDCGLVHRVRVRMHKGKLEAQFTRDNRRTGQVRRHGKA
jgi:hypothetical protein